MEKQQEAKNGLLQKFFPQHLGQNSLLVVMSLNFRYFPQIVNPSPEEPGWMCKENVKSSKA
jgi:hypothetical protein